MFASSLSEGVRPLCTQQREARSLLKLTAEASAEKARGPASPVPIFSDPRMPRNVNLGGPSQVCVCGSRPWRSHWYAAYRQTNTTPHHHKGTIGGGGDDQESLLALEFYSKIQTPKMAKRVSVRKCEWGLGAGESFSFFLFFWGGGLLSAGSLIPLQ